MDCSWGNKQWQKIQEKALIPLGIILIVMVLALNGGNEMPKTNRQIKEWPAIIKVAREYGLSQEDTYRLLALRDTEDGGPGYEFGVKMAKGTNLEEQAKHAAGSIKANRKRYQQLKQEGVFKGSRRMIGVGKSKDIELSKDDEGKFQNWYAIESKRRGLNPDPDAEKHRYAYRAYWQDAMDKVIPGTEEGAHYPSEYKLGGHLSPEYAAVDPDIDFDEFMGYYGSPTGYGYAPIHAPGLSENEQKLNKNWAGNLRSLTEKYSKRIREKGVALE